MTEQEIKNAISLREAIKNKWGIRLACLIIPILSAMGCLTPKDLDTALRETRITTETTEATAQEGVDIPILQTPTPASPNQETAVLKSEMNQQELDLLEELKAQGSTADHVKFIEGHISGTCMAAIGCNVRSSPNQFSNNRIRSISQGEHLNFSSVIQIQLSSDGKQSTEFWGRVKNDSNRVEYVCFSIITKDLSTGQTTHQEIVRYAFQPQSYLESNDTENLLADGDNPPTNQSYRNLNTKPRIAQLPQHYPKKSKASRRPDSITRHLRT